MSRQRPERESLLQKKIIEHLNSSDLGCMVYRLKRSASYDAIRNRFIATHSKLPCIFGIAADGKAIVLIVKWWDKKTKNVKRPRKWERSLLQAAADRSPYVGLAYSIEDAYNIVKNDQITHPREIRTWHYLDLEDKKEHEYANQETRPKKPKAKSPTGCPWLNLSDEPFYKRGAKAE